LALAQCLTNVVNQSIFQAFYHQPKSEEVYDLAYCTLHIICFMAGLYRLYKSCRSRATRTPSRTC